MSELPRTGPAQGTPIESEARRLQTDYYTRTAFNYDAGHMGEVDEHTIALGWLAALIRRCGISSVLHVGSGTGRVLTYLKQLPGLELRGVEPVAALRDAGHAKGLTPDELTVGDALALDFQANTYDLVCAFGVLRHIKDHHRAVAEMCRVARRAVFISDANNFGQGSLTNRIVKQVLHAMGLWRAFDFARTAGKGYHYSEGDGVFYSYILIDDLPVIRTKFGAMYWMSTRPSGTNLFRSAPSLALFATASDSDHKNAELGCTQDKPLLDG
jgi:ubiquinone/menaquinone biosynthesis C-methylase UbiE